MKKVKKNQDKFKNIPQFFNMGIGKKCSANLPKGSLAEQIIKVSEIEGAFFLKRNLSLYIALHFL